MKPLILFSSSVVVLLVFVSSFNQPNSVEARDALSGDLWMDFEEEHEAIEQKYRGWQYCYPPDPSESVRLPVKHASVGLQTDEVTNNVLAQVQLTLGAFGSVDDDSIDDIIPVGATYTLEYWHQESGTKIKYLGPYSACDGWLAGRQCPVHSIAEPISVNVTRTVHKEEGTFEATLQIWRDSARTQDLLCVIIPFQVSSGMPSIPSKHLDSFEPSHDSEPSVVADENTGGLLLLQSG